MEENSCDILNQYQEAWVNLSRQWKGEPADDFYESFVVKISEAIERFETCYRDLSRKINKLSEELRRFECDMTTSERGEKHE